jgi:hypothetical protein
LRQEFGFVLVAKRPNRQSDDEIGDARDVAELRVEGNEGAKWGGKGKRTEKQMKREK